jgi:hypothetical protein|nr:MAG TPA: hypothetical protein [Caudoviricetes sp.]
MANFVASPLSPAIAFILGITYLVCLAIDLKKENN